VKGRQAGPFAARVNRAVVARPDRLYVRGGLNPAGEAERLAMSESVSSPATSRPLVLAAATAAGVLLAGATALWAYFGTAVFYEMIVAGLAACF
jgi:hypothetical protein